VRTGLGVCGSMNTSGQAAETDSLLVGILVGGASSRMGRAKGLLPAPQSGSSETPSLSLVERLLELGEQGLGCPTVLVGQRPEYDVLGRLALADPVTARGPLAGMVALLRHARSLGKTRVIALSCDLPYLSLDLLRRLANHHSQASVVCPHSGTKYQALVARYQVATLPAFERALAEDKLALQPLLRELGVETFELLPGEEQQLKDWDTPQDLERDAEH